MADPLAAAEPVEPMGWKPAVKQPSWWEAMAATFRTTEDDVSTVQEKRKFEAYRSLEDALVERGVSRESLRHHDPLAFLGVPDAPVMSRVPNTDAIWKGVIAARKSDPKAFGDIPQTQQEFEQWVLNRKGATQRDQEAAERGGFGSNIVGGMAGSFTDPINVLTLPIGGGGKTVLQVMGREALVNGGLELLQTPDLKAAREARGEELTAGEAVENVLLAGAGGAVLGGLGKGVELQLEKPGRIWSPDRRAAKALERMTLPDATDADVARAFAQGVPAHVRTPDEQASLHVLERQADMEAASPYARDAAGMTAHADRLDDAFAVLEGAPRKSARVRPVASGAGLAPDIVEFFQAKGFTEAQARGIAAGIHAEAASNHNARNPSSGAMGLGQWLGPRKAELIRRYGPRPTREQQLEFLAWELRGGDHGGRAVLRAGDEASVLSAYVRDFMRPAKGAETDGDLSRGMAALGREGDDVVAAAADVDPMLRDPALDAARPSIEMPDRVEIDAPALRRDMFPDEDTWRVAQVAADAEALGVDARSAVAEMNPALAPVRATVAQDAAPDQGLGPASILTFQPAKGEPGISVRVEDGALATAVFRDADGVARGAVQYPITAEARESFPEVSSFVQPEFRRQGVATRLYDALEQKGYAVDALSGTGDLTPAGAALVNSRRQRNLERAMAAATGPREGMRDPVPGRADPDAASDPALAAEIASARADIEAKRYSDPAGPEMALQTERLTHDLKLAAEEDATIYRVDGERQGTIADLLEHHAEEDAAIAALKGCL